MSRQLEKIGHVPVRTWCGLVGGAVFVALLTALVHVLNGQVAQAQLRQMQFQTLQVARSGCAANHLGAARSLCIAQLSADTAPKITRLADVELQVDGPLEHPGLGAGQVVSTQPAGSGHGGLSSTVFVQ